MSLRILKADRRGNAHLRAEVVDATAQARALIDSARSRAAEIHEQARLEGLAAGHEEARAELAAAQLALARKRDSALAALESQAVQVALAAAKRLVHGELCTKPEAFRALVAELLQRVRHASRVTLRVHPDDLASLERAIAPAGGAGQTSGLQLESDPSLARGDCMLESDLGSIDARLETRVAALARALEASSPW